MFQIHIINKIGDKIQEYQNITGKTKQYIAKQMGYKSKQALDGAINSKNPTIKTLEMFAYFLNCETTELYEKYFLNDKICKK